MSGKQFWSKNEKMLRAARDSGTPKSRPALTREIEKLEKVKAGKRPRKRR